MASSVAVGLSAEDASSRHVLWNATVVEGGEEGTVSGVELVILSSSSISSDLSL